VPTSWVRLRVSVQGSERAGHRLVCSLPGVLGVADLAQLPDQPGVLPPRLHLHKPRLAHRRAVLGLAPGTLGGRFGFAGDRHDSSRSA
jgi:hypothetical protein